MTYEEIIKNPNLIEKYENLEKFYIDEINVLDWIQNDDEEQKILFSDKFEYKKNGKYHNINGPAIIHKNGSEYYWIDGVYYQNKSEWEKISKNLKRKKVLKKII